MEIKNIILYDADANVVGFVELILDNEVSSVRVGHNFSKEGLVLLLTVDGQQQAFNLEIDEKFSMRKVNFDEEIFVVLARRGGGDLASGVHFGKNVIGDLPQRQTLKKCANKEQTGRESEESGVKPWPVEVKECGTPRLQTVAAREVDEILRAACSFEEGGIGACEKCPYREDFFQVSGE